MEQISPLMALVASGEQDREINGNHGFSLFDKTRNMITRSAFTYITLKPSTQNDKQYIKSKGL